MELLRHRDDHRRAGTAPRSDTVYIEELEFGDRLQIWHLAEPFQTFTGTVVIHHLLGKPRATRCSP